MKIILLSGGSGTRLWPLSSDNHPKQLLKLLTDEQGHSVSMLQKVWEQLRRRGLHRSAVIATAAGQRETILAQLGDDIDLVLEPEKRDTFPAVLLAVAYLNSHRNLQSDEPVLVMPVDSMADDSFYETVFRLPEALERSQANLALLGVKPDYPSEKYGYMIPDEAPGTWEKPIAVRRFHEKPTKQEAVELLKRGGLWNGGVFCFRAAYLLDHLKRLELPLTYEELLLGFSRIAVQSFDYAIVENEDNMAAIVYDGAWKDLGTWCSLTEAMRSPMLGNGVMTEDCRDVHVVNVTDMPVIAMGLTDVVVAVSREGILVSGKKSSSRLKDALRLMQSGQPRDIPAEGIWSKTLDRECLEDGTTVTTRKIRLEKGSSLFHSEAGSVVRAVAWTILHGACTLRKNGAAIPLQTGATVVLERDDAGEVLALEPLDLIEVSTVYV
jgi:mannose-1-phosphate guanylyltransferase